MATKIKMPVGDFEGVLMSEIDEAELVKMIRRHRHCKGLVHNICIEELQRRGVTLPVELAPQSPAPATVSRHSVAAADPVSNDLEPAAAVTAAHSGHCDDDEFAGMDAAAVAGKIDGDFAARQAAFRKARTTPSAQAAQCAPCNGEPTAPRVFDAGGQADPAAQPAAATSGRPSGRRRAAKPSDGQRRMYRALVAQCKAKVATFDEEFRRDRIAELIGSDVRSTKDLNKSELWLVTEDLKHLAGLRKTPVTAMRTATGGSVGANAKINQLTVDLGWNAGRVVKLIQAKISQFIDSPERLDAKQQRQLIAIMNGILKSERRKSAAKGKP